MKKLINVFLLLFTISFYGQNDTVSVVEPVEYKIESVDTTNVIYQVQDIKNSNISVVSADKMNVVYRGLSNLISIAVPNCKSFTATGNGLYKYAEGKYQLLPGSGTESIIILDIVLDDGSIKKEVHKFRIKNLPRAYGAINGLSCDQCIIEMTKKELNNAIISVDFKMDLYGLENKDKVDSFDVEFSKNQKIINFGTTFNKETIDKINRLKLGSIIIIDYIHLPNPNNVCRISPTSIKIMIVENRDYNEEDK